MDLRAEGDLLVAREGARIPKVCVKCGATKDVSRRDQTFAVGQYGAGAGAGGGVVGVMVANVLRNAFRDEPGTQAIILTVIFAVVIVVAWIATRATPKLHLEVPLCGEHQAAIDSAIQQRTWLLLALAIAGVLAVFGIGIENMWILGLALAVVFGAVGVAYAVGMPRAWIKARWARDGQVALEVGPEVAKKIVERAEKRAQKKSAEKSAPKGDDDEAAEGAGDEASPPA